MQSDGLTRFEAVLVAWARRYCELANRPSAVVALPTDFHSDEAIGFLRAVDAGIVRVTDSGRCTLPSIHRASAKPTEPCLFSQRPDGSVYLAWREYITQVGAVASLVLDYGWPVGLVALDPRTLEFDVAGFASSTGGALMIVAGETKKTQTELYRLLAQMHAASRSDFTPGRRAPADGQKKFRGLLKERPPYFWAVAPGVRKSFRVTYEGQTAALEEIADLPTYSAASQGCEAL
jgi:hypothetical protein